MLKMLFSFKMIGGLLVLALAGKFFLRSRSNQKATEESIYKNVSRAIYNGYERARKEEEEEE